MAYRSDHLPAPALLETKWGTLERERKWDGAKEGLGFPENDLWACEFLSGFCFLVFFSSTTATATSVMVLIDDGCLA